VGERRQVNEPLRRAEQGAEQLPQGGERNDT
jgi:hypothetical protein